MTTPAPVGVRASVRVWTEYEGNNRRDRRKVKGERKLTGDREREAARENNPTHILVIDTETTIGYEQALTFGTWSHCLIDGDGKTVPVEEGIFYGDDLPETDPEGFRCLREYAANHRARVDERQSQSVLALQLQSRTEFAETAFRSLAWKAQAHIVMFNKPFDISRMASHAGPSKLRMYGGFSFRIFKADMYGPRVVVKHIDSKKSLTSFTLAKEGTYGQVKGSTNHRNWVDLRTLAFALTNNGYSLDSACKAFGVDTSDEKTKAKSYGKIDPDFVEYARNDVRATAALFEKLYAAHRALPVQLSITKAMTPASYGKAFLRQLGVTPRLSNKKPDPQKDPTITSELMGKVMETFFGARSEVRIRQRVVPVELHDFTSMYPTVNALMGLWDLLTAREIVATEATADVQEFLDSVTLGSMFNPASWRNVVGVVELIPSGDVLPVRANYSDADSESIGINPVYSDTPLWYSLPDVVASVLLTGKVPQIRSAYRFHGEGKQESLRTIEFDGQTIDPTTTDFFVALVEMRARVKTRIGCKSCADNEKCQCADHRMSEFLKIGPLNAGSYGIFAQFTAADTPEDVRDRVRVFTGADSFTADVPSAEEPGEFCFPPLATCITGSARLMLAMLERCVTDKGGRWMFTDTDSMGIVASADGGVSECAGGTETTDDGSAGIRVLTYTDTAEIRERFALLSPYDVASVKSLLKRETFDSFGFAISAKRYVLFTAAGKVLKGSEHGLGHVQNPTNYESTDRGWIRQYWEWFAKQLLGLPADDEPYWFDRPTAGQTSFSKPALLARCDHWNEGKSYRDRIKPFGFASTMFCMKDAARLLAVRLPALIGPYERDSRKWSEIVWTDIQDSGPKYRMVEASDPRYQHVLTTAEVVDDDGCILFCPQTYRELFTHHALNPEYKFLGPNGKPCSPHTDGWLDRRPTRITTFKHMGKESNRIEDLEIGLIGAYDEDPTTVYLAEGDDWEFRTALEVLSDLSADEIAALVSRPAAQGSAARPTTWTASTIYRLRNGTMPRNKLRNAVVATATEIARQALVQSDSANELDLLSITRPTDVLTRWKSGPGKTGQGYDRPCSCECGSQVVGRAKYVNNSHRMRAKRQSKITVLAGRK